MPRPPCPSRNISEEEERTFQTACTIVDQYLEKNDNGQQYFVMETDLKVSTNSRILERIVLAYRAAGWREATILQPGPSRTVVHREKGLILVLERPQ